MSPDATIPMGDVERWHRGNDAYLSAALVWLRLRLRQLANEPSEAAVDSESPNSPPGRRGLFRRRPRPALPPPALGVDEAELRRAHGAMQAAERSLEPPPALRIIGDRLGLSTFERQVLLLCVAMELDTRTAELCHAAHGQPHPTFALALALFDDPSWDVLSPERPLRYWRLVEINQPAAQTLTASALRADERIVNAIKGLIYLDDRISSLLVALEVAPPEDLPPSQRDAVDEAVGYLRRHHSRPAPVLHLLGTDGASARLVARHAAAALDLALYELPADAIPGQGPDLDTLARLWRRESLLAPVALYVDGFDLEAGSATQRAVLRFLSRTDGILFLASREPMPRLSRPSHLLDVARPTQSEQRNLWRSLLEDATAVRPGALAAQFDLDVAAIQRTARDALEHSDDDSLQEHVWSACRQVARPRLESLAQRIEAKATWDRLVLPEAQLSLLRSIAEQVAHRSIVYEDWGFAETMNRGLGISALFAGESGTGKTMAAEVIANELQLDLYRIDLSSVVSKYIGETEKNLRSLFDAAENGGAILFFDEADALFGKRSEVKDAHDRYANIEINYLLQRMEAYRGLAILATNMKSALDPAFVRRLRFIVDFPFPGRDDRRRMWGGAFPSATPTEALDLDRLARIDLTGANIHNAALNAAFLAAHRGQPVGMPEVLEAARNELRKLERPINEAEFRWEAGGALA